MQQIRPPKHLNICQKFTYSIVTNIENFFYSLGYAIGSKPKSTILICWGVVFLSSFGFVRFHQEKNPIKLWVPPHSTFVKDTEWIISKFQRGFRVEVALIEAKNVLTPKVLMKLYNVDEMVHNSITINNVTWADVCFRIPKVDKKLLAYLENKDEEKLDPSAQMNAALYCSFAEGMKTECFEKSILELWGYNKTLISQLTQQDIINMINTYDKNEIYGRLKSYEELISGIERNETGHIVSARALQNFWMVNVNFSAVDMDKSGNTAGTADWASEEVLDWELEFEKIMHQVEMNNTQNFSLYYTSSRSFGDISSSTMFQDIGKLMIGISVMVLYVIIVISKFNLLETRILLAILGVLAIGMAFITGCGLCSLIGISYGPIHTSLPFLLMGLGVDDMFVIIACWIELENEPTKNLPDKIGLMLKHAGISITVTSVTDILAFLIGSSTILPSLQSYCFYAAFGVLMTFIYAITFFTACFVLDQKRIYNKRNFICIELDESYKPNQCSQNQWSKRFFHYIYSKLILTTTGKIVIITITLICLGFSIESCFKLEQRFDPTWFIPDHTHLKKYLNIRKEYYSDNGFEAGIYLGSLNYTEEIKKISLLVNKLENNTQIVGDIVSWVEPFRNYVINNFKTDIYEEILSEDYFNLYLSMFLFSPKNAKYQANIHFTTPLECGIPAPKIILSNIDFRFHYFTGPEEYLPAMHLVQDLTKNANFTSGDRFATAWSKVFATWITDELIDVEVMRNLQLALLSVMTCTILLIADLQTCFWIFICVLLTMINVCGFMQRWGLTIDMVSCIGLELAIGLCVDYATHIGHTFLTIPQGSRYDRSLKTVTSIGSAVLYGGLSTLIGVFMLSQSDAYTFQAFFKIFFLVVLFGLFHGVVLMPVIFSWVGPKPYSKYMTVNQIEMN